MHEQSETVQRNGKWVNVYGRKTPSAGKALPLKHPFEQKAYDTVEAAVSAAKKRSLLEPEEDDLPMQTAPGREPVPPSHLPQGTGLSPVGDLGLKRGQESIAAGGFKVGKSVRASFAFKKFRG